LATRRVRDNGGVQGYRDDGVVLRTQKLGEADRIITLLTRQNGRVRAVAKGVRRTKSRFGGRLEPFTHVDVLVHPGRSLDTITQAEVIRAYGARLAADYPRYTAGTAMLETAEKFTPVEKEPAIRQFLLLVGGLRTLGEAAEPDADEEADEEAEAEAEAAGLDEEAGAGLSHRAGPPGPPELAGPHDPASPVGPPGPSNPAAPAAPPGPAAPANPAEPVLRLREPRLVLDAYLLRSLALEGYTPALTECARCGSAGVPLVGFAVAAGGMVCDNCRPPGAASPAPPTIALMIALLRGDWDAATASERRHRVECSGLVAAYLQWHLEHSIRSLRHVERA
jgi:recombinational DNA repair protein (RecF pathway)